MRLLIILTSFNSLILISMVLVVCYCVYLDYKQKAKKYFDKQNKKEKKRGKK